MVYSAPFCSRNAVLARYMLWRCVRLSFCPSLRLSQAKHNVGSRKQRGTIARGLVFWHQRTDETRMESFPTEVPNTGGGD